MEKFYTKSMTASAQAQYYIDFNYEHILNLTLNKTPYE